MGKSIYWWQGFYSRRTATIGFVDNSDSFRQRPRLWISWFALGNAAELVCESSPSISSTAMSHASVTSPGSWPSFPERTLAGRKVHMTDWSSWHDQPRRVRGGQANGCLKVRVHASQKDRRGIFANQGPTLVSWQVALLISGIPRLCKRTYNLLGKQQYQNPRWNSFKWSPASNKTKTDNSVSNTSRLRKERSSVYRACFSAATPSPAPLLQSVGSFGLLSCRWPNMKRKLLQIPPFGSSLWCSRLSFLLMIRRKQIFVVFARMFCCLAWADSKLVRCFSYIPYSDYRGLNMNEASRVIFKTEWDRYYL